MDINLSTVPFSALHTIAVDLARDPKYAAIKGYAVINLGWDWAGVHTVRNVRVSSVSFKKDIVPRLGKQWQERCALLDAVDPYTQDWLGATGVATLEGVGDVARYVETPGSSDVIMTTYRLLMDEEELVKFVAAFDGGQR